MSNWSSTQLTSLGQALEAKVTAGTTTLVFTKMELGSGNTTPGDIAAMTDLTAPEMVLGISSCAVSEADSTVCEVVAVASSSDVVSSFAVREMGLFATDPDEGEILYAVSIDTVPDTMPNNTVASPATVSYQMDIIAANAANVTAIINPAGLVTASILQAHNDSISAHKMSHWYRQDSKVYAVGDIAFSASLPSYLVLDCTTPGTTAATEPDFSGAAEDNTVTDGEVTWTYKSLVGGANPDLSNLTQDGEDHFLEKDYIIIYPNGTESTPMNIALNTRYVVSNPFAGYAVVCQPEILHNGEWGEAPARMYFNGSNNIEVGISAIQLDNDNIIVQTGIGYLLIDANAQGQPFGAQTPAPRVSTAPFRLKVWKIGKVSA